MQENQLDEAINTGNSFLNDHKSNAGRYGVIRRILSYTNKQLIENRSIEFSWKDLAEEGSEFENEGKTLKRLIGESIKELNEHNAKLNQIALNNGYHFLPKIKQTKIGGGAGKPNIYKLEAISVDLEPLDINIPSDHIKYKLEKIANPNFVARWVNNYVAQGLKFKLLVGGMSSVIVSGLLIILFGLYSLHQAETLLALVKVIIGFGSLLFSVYYFGSPLYQCVTKRIVNAPVMLTPGDIKTAQLEYVPTGDKDRNGRSIRQFRIVSYSAICPICEGKIELEEGIDLMKGRLVGSCTESPREHIFTFDHKTKSGRACYPEYEGWNERL